MAFENGVLLEDWRYGVIFQLHRSKGERTECSNYRSSRVGKVNESLIDDEQGGGSEQGGGV